MFPFKSSVLRIRSLARLSTRKVERYRLPAPSIVGGIEDLGAVLIHNGKDAAQIVREGKIMFRRAVLPDGNRVAVKVVELARYAVFHDLFVFPA